MQYKHTTTTGSNQDICQHRTIIELKQKSVDAAIKSEQKHVTKQKTRPTIVIATTAEVRTEKQKDKPQDTEKLEYTLNELKINGIKDYQIYQNGDVNEFFTKNSLETANTVADICLVNDHFILVKMTEKETSLMNNMEINEAATGRKDFRDLKDKSKAHPKESKKLCRYLRNRRNRITQIAPIHEEPEDQNDNAADHTISNSNCLNINSCWQTSNQEVETYRTKTKIYKNFTNTTNNCPEVLKQSMSPSPQAAAEKPNSLDLKQAPVIPTISGSILKSSLQYQVALHPYGSMLDSTQNNSNTFNRLEMINSRTRRRRCPRLESFYWLLRPFRGKCRKTEPKIQAVVYKTYFVKWTKPPETLTHGYGVKSLKSSHVEMSVLRRCRSAVF